MKLNLAGMFDNIDFEELSWRAYYDELVNKNNFSYWYPRITHKSSKFKTPESLVLQFTKRERELILKSYEEPDNVSFEDVVAIINSKLDLEPEFNLNRKLFIKNGTYSNKFNFNTCVIDEWDLELFVSKFLEINYEAMLRSAGGTTEVVLREYIESDKTAEIYAGMPLNTEFRVFYDFDKHEIIKTVEYWDVDYMLENGMFEFKDDIQVLQDNKEMLKKSFNDNKERIEQHLIDSVFKKTSLEGQWSIDFMIANDEIYLIDMALAHQSAYYNK